MDALRLQEAIRELSAVAVHLGLRPCSYVVRGTGYRALRRSADGRETFVTIPRQGRTDEAIVTDLIEGLLAANGLPLDHQHRSELFAAVTTNQRGT